MSWQRLKIGKHDLDTHTHIHTTPLSVSPSLTVFHTAQAPAWLWHPSRLQGQNVGFTALLLPCLAWSLAHPLVSAPACDLTFLGDAHPNALPPFLSASTREASRVLRHGGLVLKAKCKFPLSERNGNESRGRHFFIVFFLSLLLLTVAFTCLFNCMAALFCCPLEQGFTLFIVLALIKYQLVFFVFFSICLFLNRHGMVCLFCIAEAARITRRQTQAAWHTVIR